MVGHFQVLLGRQQNHLSPGPQTRHLGRSIQPVEFVTLFISQGRDANGFHIASLPASRRIF